MSLRRLMIAPIHALIPPDDRSGWHAITRSLLGTDMQEGLTRG